MNRCLRAALLLLVLIPLACAGPRVPPPVEPEPVSAPEPAVLPTFVWTPRAGLPLRTEGGSAVVPHLFSRLEVLGTDSLGIHVSCSFCREPVRGWIEREEVIYEPLTPHLAAHGELAEFLLALRDAAVRLDLELLRPVMARDFINHFDAPEGAEEAISRWRWEQFRTLDHLPRLLDRGVASRDGRLWTSPPDFLTDASYEGLRAGFRRSGDRWEWLFLVGRP